MGFKIFVLSFFLPGILAAQGIGHYKSGFQKKGNEFSLVTSNGEMKIEFCTPSMFRVRATWNGTFEDQEPWMVIKYDWSSVTVSAVESKEFFSFQTTALRIKLNKSSLHLEVRNSEGKLLSSESTPGRNQGSSKQGDTVKCTKALSPNEHFFGFGERMDFLDRRNKIVKLNVGRGRGPYIVGAYNILEANYCPIPFFMSTEGYGIFFHNAFPTEWDMGASNQHSYTFSAAGGELDYYFIYGPKFPQILNNYTALTGKTPLMPEFAYGLHVGTYSGGTWGYEQFSSDKYVIELARRLREMGIPVDILWLDSTWRIFGSIGGKGATSFEWRETFDDPKKMFDSLYAMHYAMVGLHLRPRFDNGKKIRLLDTAQQFKYVYPEKGLAGDFVNFFDSASVDFWWNHGVLRVASVGAKFLKTDEGSAFGALANESDKIGPQGKQILKLHNLFPIAYAKAPYEKFQQYNHLRGLNQTREGYAGIQRYPYIFAGDWPSEWQYFAPVIKAGLNIGLSGISDWAHCMGGFEHVPDSELYIRWVQFGMLSPVALVFGMDHPGYKEPWRYGEDALSNFKKYDSLRYRLLPYIYSQAFNNYKTGMPIMRALVLDYQGDENVYELADQYMFGDALMICPVTTKGAHSRTVYLPQGQWFDWWTGKKIVGKQFITAITPLDTIPIFAKAGAIIPMQEVTSYVGEKQPDKITLDIFPGANNSFNLYEDEGRGLDYQHGAYATTKIDLVSSPVSLQIVVGKPEGKFQPISHHFLLKIHSDKRPTNVFQNGQLLNETGNNSHGWFYDSKQNVIWVTPQAEQNLLIDVRF